MAAKRQRKEQAGVITPMRRRGSREDAARHTLDGSAKNPDTPRKLAAFSTKRLRNADEGGDMRSHL
ncbi:hypothetical protein N7519_004598 [Penicillium mononematosum]|uniref:uncharacterized protein n=1 Tax=Penicillium mononematosum TaxID=268346 RepID=UPI002547AD4E|nr:uncharacterized protein N7519_004598 [Penicillium mononematosum]KAJ6189690.1 hypothetical protein N7519_004598 [Penicillium mononematosum]